MSIKGSIGAVRDRSYRLLVEGLVDVAMSLVDADGTILTWNEGAQRITRYPAAEAIGRNFAMLSSAAAVADGEPARAFSIAQAGGSHVSDGWRIRRDGSRFWANVTIDALRDERGRLIGYATVTRDITERSIDEEQRRLIVEAAPNGMIVFDEDGIVTMANPRADRIFGYRPGSVIGLGVERLLSGKGLEWAAYFQTWRGLDRSAALSQYCGQREVIGRRRDGTTFAADVTFNVTPTSRGPAAVASVTDITARRRSEEALRDANRLMSMAEEMAHHGHWQLELPTRTLVCSDEVCRIYGLPSVSTGALEAIAPAGEHQAGFAEVLRRAAVDGEPFVFEGRLGRPDKSVRDVRVAGRGERDADGELCALFGILHDITDRKDAERERKTSTTFQRAVLPLRLPRVTGCTFDAVYEPGLSESQVGGDWYDAAQLSDGQVLVSIGDVCGSGLEAAVVVGVVRQVMRGVAQLHSDPVLIIDAADRALRLEYPDVYVSAWVGLIDFVERTITFASAGHPPPLVVLKDGSVRELGDPTTLLIGLREGHHAKASTVALGECDTLVLYTDGIIEAGRDVIEGYRLVRDAASRLALTRSEHPADDIREHVIPAGSVDDVAILVVRTDCAQAERAMRRWRFEVRDGEAAAAVRRGLLESLEAAGFNRDECANAELVFAELIGNVLTHAQATGAVDVALDHGGSNSVLHVLDRGGGFRHIGRLPLDPYAESGRGLFLVAALTLDFAVSERPSGGSHARAVLSGGRARKTPTRLITRRS